MKNLLLRSLSGLVFVSLVIGSIFLNNEVSGLVFMFFALVCQYEFLRMFKMIKSKSQLFVVQGLSFLTYTLMYVIANDMLPLKFLSLFFVLLLLLSIYELYQKTSTPAKNVAVSLFSIIYTIVPFGFIHFLLNIDHLGTDGKMLVLVSFSLVWLNDTAAYLVGSAIGKHRLFERISPKKSWEGSIGGFVFVSIATLVLSQYYSFFSTIEWFILGMIVVTFANYGDLVESMFKREAGIKDSGNIMPGHGGLLDRLDAILFTIPAVLFYVYLLY